MSEVRIRERITGETAPHWQCPSCGVAYAKVAAAMDADRRPMSLPRPAAGGAGKFARFILLLVAIGIGVALSSVIRPTHDMAAPPQGYAGASVVMYSLTTCGYCNMKRAELKQQGIPFVEYFVDKDPARHREMFDKLQAAGYRGGVGTPTFEVNGKMLPNNPSLGTIRKHL